MMPAQNADVPPVTERGSLNRATEHGDLFTCVNRHFFGLYGHSATIFWTLLPLINSAASF